LPRALLLTYKPFFLDVVLSLALMLAVKQKQIIKEVVVVNEDIRRYNDSIRERLRQQQEEARKRFAESYLKGEISEQEYRTKLILLGIYVTSGVD
jgi:uncharacterized membrane protein